MVLSAVAPTSKLFTPLLYIHIRREKLTLFLEKLRKKVIN